MGNEEELGYSTPPRMRYERGKSPHIADYKGLSYIDYNGVGIWSAEGIQKRYRKYADLMGMKAAHLVPRRSTEGVRAWLWPVMDQIIELIEKGDKAAVEIGVEFIQEDEYFAFGKILKSNTARALRRVPLTDEQQARIRERLVSMLLAGEVPHEWREYKRLLRRVGVDPLWPVLEKGVDRENKYVMRYYDYLDRFARSS